MKVFMAQICTVLCEECIRKAQMKFDDVVQFDEVDFIECAMCGRTKDE